jgi:hypothetical protein
MNSQSVDIWYNADEVWVKVHHDTIIRPLALMVPQDVLYSFDRVEGEPENKVIFRTYNMKTLRYRDIVIQRHCDMVTL